MSDYPPRTLKSEKRPVSNLYINSAATTLNTEAVPHESKSHDNGVMTSFDESDASFSPLTITSSLLPMKLAGSHSSGTPFASIDAENLTSQQPKPALAVYPFLVDALAADFPAVRTAAVSAVIFVPQADSSCGTTINNILCATDNMMSDLKIPSSRRRSVLTNLRRLIVTSSQTTVLESLLPLTWVEAARFLQSLHFEALEKPSTAALNFVLEGLPPNPTTHLPASIGTPSSVSDDVDSDDEALANITELWSYLKSSLRPSLQDSSSPHLQTIELPEEMWWPFGDGIKNILFVRPSQQDTLNRIMDTYKEHLSEQNPKRGSGPTGFIVKGTPGIGTTGFLNLLFYCASDMGVDVVLHDAADFIFVLRSNGAVKAIPLARFYEEKRVLKRRTLYLFNPDGENTRAVRSPAFTVIATSPNVKHYSNFRKLMKMNVLFLYPWTREEARAALQALQPTEELSAEQGATLCKRFDEVGGCLRYLTYDQQTYDTGVTPHLNSTETILLAPLLNWVNIVEENESASDKKREISHILFHCFPDTENKSPFKIGSASRLSQERFRTAVELQSQEEWDDFVTIMLRIDPSQSSLGQSLAQYIHVYMKNYNNMTEEITVLDSDDKPVATLKRMAVYKVSSEPEEDVAAALHCGRRAYIVRRKRNYDVLDSFYIEDATVYCFKITTGIDDDLEHKPTEYDAITRMIESAYLKKANGDVAMKSPTFMFCWVHDTKTQIPARPDIYHIYMDKVYE